MLERCYQTVCRSFREHSPGLYGLAFRHRVLGKYILAGGTAAAADLLLLYVFTDLVRIWYLFSSILAFIIAFGVSFTLQKFWTFRDRSKDDIHVQASLYFAVSVINLFVNTVLIYLFVDYVRLYYVFAQVAAGILIACSSFFIYRRFIFKKSIYI